MTITDCLWLPVITVIMALISTVNGRLTDTDIISVSCGDQSFYHPVHGNVACRRVCPPSLTADANVRFCRLNCAAYYECLRSALPVINVEATSNSTCPSSWFYHPRHGFVDCRRICGTSDITQYCKNNCPMHYACLTQ